MDKPTKGPTVHVRTANRVMSGRFREESFYQVNTQTEICIENLLHFYFHVSHKIEFKKRTRESHSYEATARNILIAKPFKTALKRGAKRVCQKKLEGRGMSF